MRCGANATGGLNSGVRFSRKSTNENERRLFQSWWNELNQLYGTYVDYYTYDYSLSAHDFFFGEHPLAPFSGPTPMIMMAQFNNDSQLLSKFGIRTDADVTFIIPILTYRAAFNSNTAEPKAGDLIRLTELGWDRPGGVDDLNTLVSETSTCSGWAANDPLSLLCSDGVATVSSLDCRTDSTYYSAYNDIATFERLTRGATIYEITERRDENLTMNYNMLQGHYVWILHGKRFDYSYQPNAPREPGHDQVSDETMYGKLSGGSDYPERQKLYNGNVEDESKRIWDYSKRPNSDTSVYGNY
jgi:hypothetical protein